MYKKYMSKTLQEMRSGTLIYSATEFNRTRLNSGKFSRYLKHYYISEYVSLF